jgi:RHS repeat-associated protein
MRLFKILSLLNVLCFLCLPVFAQDDPNFETGLKPFGSYHGGDIDTINLMNGNMSLKIPLISYPQRGGKLKLDFVMFYKNLGEYYDISCNSDYGCYLADGAYSFNQAAGIGAEGFSGTATCTEVISTYSCVVTATTTDGAVHQLAPTGSGSTWTAVDSSGYGTSNFVATAHQPTYPTPPFSIADANGVTSTNNSSGVVTEDPNGNQIVLGDGYSGWIDSLGRTIPITPPNASTSTTDYSRCAGPLPMTAAYIWNPPGLNGGTYELELCYVSVPESAQAYPSGTNNYMQTQLQSLVLPNGTAWIFQYTTDGFGDLSQVTFPTGGTLSYTWGSGIFAKTICSDYTYVLTRAIATRTLNPNDGTTPPSTWTYTYTFNSSSSTSQTVVTDPAGNATVHSFTDLGGSNYCGFYETQTQSYQGSNTTGTLLQTTNRAYSFVEDKYVGNWVTSPVMTNETTILSNNQQKQVKYSYQPVTFRPNLYNSSNGLANSSSYNGYYGLVTSKAEYDFGSGGAGSLLRTTSTSYLAFSNSAYLTNNLLNLPSSVKVTDGGGTQRALTNYTYDGSTPVPSGITTGVDPSPPFGTALGNLTSVARWLNTSSSYLTSTNAYFNTGEIDTATDPKNNTTTYAYSSTYAGAYPTTVTNALNQSATTAYDFNTGLITSTTDANGQTTSYTYDNMLRTTQINNPDGGQATFSYPNPNQVDITEAISSSVNRLSYLLVDGVGRKIRQAVTNGEPKPYDEADTCYDGLGRVSFSSYPFQDSGPFATSRSCGSPELGDSFTFDGLSRTTKVTHSDGSYISTSYSGSSTTVTDEQGKTRQSTTDGLGRLTQVIENPGGLGYSTAYTFDALGDLTGVTQAGSRQRTFVFDSLSRLTSSTNPEANWAPATQTTVATTYAYDADGNLINKSEPAPNQQSTSSVTLTYCYDALNRITAKGYTSQTCSNGLLPTPVATYVYDGGSLPSGCSVGSFSYGLIIGRRSAMCDGAGSEAWSYNVVSGVGWQITDQRTTNALTKTVVYQNDFLSLPTSVQYPSGRTISYNYNAGARPTYALDGTTSVYYANTAHYWANGAPCWTVYGAAITGAVTYNGRLQPLEMQTTGSVVGYPGTGCPGLGTTGNLLDLTFNFNYGSGDNGNVVGITNNRDTTRSQAFTYDALNRIVTATASTYAISPAHCWGEAYQFDNQTTGGAWGNLTSIGVASTAYTGCTQESLSVTATAQNRISNSTSYGYDAAGNLTTAPSATYSYDAENHLTSTSGVNYTYDGDGKRVEKSNGKIYWYGMDGNVLDETDLTGSTTNSSFNEYVFFDGSRIARHDSSNNVFYYAADHLGTSRVIAEVPSGGTTAALCYDADFYPFGGERAYTTTCSQNYKFTAKERDAESDLDNFAARYDASSMGRFMSADPSDAVTLRIVNPQRWNMYAYAVNDPLSYNDPSGRDAIAVNFTKEVAVAGYNFGHEAIISVHSDGSATYARFGPATPNSADDSGKVISSTLGVTVQFGKDGFPTPDSYAALAKAAAQQEGQPPDTVRMNYFKTSDADTVSLDNWIKAMQYASDRGHAPQYIANRQNCAVFCIAGLLNSHAIQNKGLSITPNRLFDLLSIIDSQSYSQQTVKQHVTMRLCHYENGQLVCTNVTQ